MKNQNLTIKAKELKSSHEKRWMDMEEVVSVGVGIVGDKPGIIILVKGNALSVSEKIPAEIDGIPIKITESGEIRAQ